jgi:hypothetical protein
MHLESSGLMENRQCTHRALKTFRSQLGSFLIALLSPFTLRWSAIWEINPFAQMQVFIPTVSSHQQDWAPYIDLSRHPYLPTISNVTPCFTSMSVKTPE